MGGEKGRSGESENCGKMGSKKVCRLKAHIFNHKLERQKQEDCHEFGACLVSIESSRVTCASE